MAVTIKDVAAAAGVSTATVSHVFNATRFVAPETAERVREAAKQLGYIPSINASSLRSNRSKRIGLLVPSIASFFSVDILDAVEQVLVKNGYQLVLGCSHENLEREKEQVDIFNYQQIDGMLMFPAPGDHSYLDSLPKDYPIVFLDRSADNCVRDAVMGNNEQAAYEIVCQMICEGHRCIGVVNGTEGVSALTERVEGYKRALRDNGIPFDPALVQNGASTSKGGYQATRQLLENRQISAILSLSPAMTVGCFHYLIEHKIPVPQQIAIVSFGDSEWAEITDPPLTTMRHPLFEMGQMAAQRLLMRLEEAAKAEQGQPKAPYETVRLPIGIVRRKTF